MVGKKFQTGFLVAEDRLISHTAAELAAANLIWNIIKYVFI